MTSRSRDLNRAVVLWVNIPSPSGRTSSAWPEVAWVRAIGIVEVGDSFRRVSRIRKRSPSVLLSAVTSLALHQAFHPLQQDGRQ